MKEFNKKISCVVITNGLYCHAKCPSFVEWKCVRYGRIVPPVDMPDFDAVKADGTNQFIRKPLRCEECLNEFQNNGD